MHTIEIIGLGSGDLDQLPLGVYKRLKGANRPYARTKEHPVIKELAAEGIEFTSFDNIYEKYDQFEAVYEEIVRVLLEKAENEDLLYAVPGHPMMAERTVQLLLERARWAGAEVKITGGQSFLDSLFTAVKIDPIEGFQLLDGTALNKEDANTAQHVIIAQVYDAFTASDVKLALMERYPDEHEVIIIESAGGKEENIRRLPLYQIDWELGVNNLRSLYIPPLPSPPYSEFSTLRSIIAELRGPEGCPWDKKQTHESLKKYLIEEVYELLEAIDEEDIDHMIEELGDVLLQVMLHAQIGEDEGMFSIDEVIESISKKMIRRHPHVFGSASAETAEDVVANWEEIKRAEKSGAESPASMLDKAGKGLPAMLRAYEYQKLASKTGFDWDTAEEALEKVKEEMQEFQEEVAKGTTKEKIAEMGDLLFAVINAARLAGVQPEEALQMTNDKFRRRFSYVEGKVRESGKPFEQFTLEQLDRFWDEAKQSGK